MRPIERPFGPGHGPASLGEMHETDVPESAAPVGEPVPPQPAEGDAVLDGFETDLDNVSAALDALDADDLDTAEALVAGLGEADGAPDPASDAAPS